MKVMGIITNVGEINRMNGGVSFNISLGYNKGFAKVIWWFNENLTRYQVDIQKGDTVIIPIGDLNTSEFTSKTNGKVYLNVNINTNYIEKYTPYVKKDKLEDRKEEVVEEFEEDTKEAFSKIGEMINTIPLNELSQTNDKQQEVDVDDWESDIN